MHPHHHTHHHAHDHTHGESRAAPYLLPLALALTLGFALVEAVAGWQANSLALLGDAGHMLTDSLALALAAFAAWLARKPPTARHSYGMGRVEVLAALVNAGFMLAVVIGIAWSAVTRFSAAQSVAVAGETVTWVAAIGLAVNIGVAWLLSRGEHNMNTRAAMLHVLGDILGSVAALVAGAVILLTGWMLIDPLLSLFICALILTSTLRLAREALHLLVEGVPPAISLAAVGQRLAQTAGVVSVHDLHIWSLSSLRVALSAHIVVRRLGDWEELLPRLAALLHDEFDIGHITLQPEAQQPILHTIAEPAEPR